MDSFTFVSSLSFLPSFLFFFSFFLFVFFLFFFFSLSFFHSFAFSFIRSPPPPHSQGKNYMVDFGRMAQINRDLMKKRPVTRKPAGKPPSKPVFGSGNLPKAQVSLTDSADTSSAFSFVSCLFLFLFSQSLLFFVFCFFFAFHHPLTLSHPSHPLSSLLSPLPIPIPIPPSPLLLHLTSQIRWCGRGTMTSRGISMNL